MSLGIVIVEAARRSAASSRPVSPASRAARCSPCRAIRSIRAEGTNGLIKQGEVTVVTEAADIVAVLAPMLRGAEERPRAALQPPHPVTAAPVNPQGYHVARGRRSRPGPGGLRPAPIDLDALARATGLGARALQVALIELALAGRIERHGHQMVSRIA